MSDKTDPKPASWLSTLLTLVPAIVIGLVVGSGLSDWPPGLALAGNRWIVRRLRDSLHGAAPVLDTRVI